MRIVDWALIPQRGIARCRLRLPPQRCTPLAKTGGLADVVGALPPELVKLGHQVSVYLPFYARMRQQIEGEPKIAVRSITIPFRSYNRFVGVVDGGKRDGVQYYFIDCPELFDRKELYGVRRRLCRQCRALRPVLPGRYRGIESSSACPMFFTFTTGRPR